MFFLVGEALVKHLKFSSFVLNLVYLEKRNRQTFEDWDSLGDRQLVSFSSSLFDWSQAWGLTPIDSLPLFLCSLLFCN